MSYRQRLGRQGEALARKYLSSKGIHVLASNWRDGRRGEIDIVAYDHAKHRLRFVEVKTRNQMTYGHAIEAVTQTKQNTIRQLAQRYIEHNQEQEVPLDFKEVSFDIITIQNLSGPAEPVIEFIESAF